MAIMPMPAAQAAAEPLMAAMMTHATMAAFERPPQRWPRQTRPKPKSDLLTPPTVIRFPMRRKNGIDMSVIPETCENIRWGTRKRRAGSPPAKRKVAIDANPMVTAVLTPRSISTSTAAKMTNISMKPGSFYLTRLASTASRSFFISASSASLPTFS